MSSNLCGSRTAQNYFNLLQNYATAAGAYKLCPKQNHRMTAFVDLSELAVPLTVGTTLFTLEGGGLWNILYNLFVLCFMLLADQAVDNKV